MDKIYIYTLSDPNTNFVRYVGISKNVNRRYIEHIRESIKGKNYKCCWIRSLKDRRPIVDIIDECDNTNYSFWEKFYISLFKSWGFKLTNLNDGGEGNFGYKYSDDQKIKRSISSG